MKPRNNKLKRLSPSLREKKRYLAFEIISDSRIDDFNVISQEINSNYLACAGSFSAQSAGINVIYDKWNQEKQRGIIRVGHKHVDELKASLALLKQINSTPIIAKSIGLSGILKKASEYVK